MRFGEQALTASLPAEQTNAEEGAFPAKHPEGRCLASAGGGGADISSDTEQGVLAE